MLNKPFDEFYDWICSLTVNETLLAEVKKRPRKSPEQLHAEILQQNAEDELSLDITRDLLEVHRNTGSKIILDTALYSLKNYWGESANIEIKNGKYYLTNNLGVEVII